MSHGPSTFGTITTSSLSPICRDDGEEVVEDPRAVQAVDARPERRVAELVVLRDLDEALSRRLLVRRRDRVFEVAQQHVHLRDQLRDLRAHLLVLRREEVDHPVRPRGHLTLRRGRADRERIRGMPWDYARAMTKRMSLSRVCMGAPWCERDYMGSPRRLATAKIASVRLCTDGTIDERPQKCDAHDAQRPHRPRHRPALRRESPLVRRRRHLPRHRGFGPAGGEGAGAHAGGGGHRRDAARAVLALRAGQRAAHRADGGRSRWSRTTGPRWS